MPAKPVAVRFVGAVAKGPYPPYSYKMYGYDRSWKPLWKDDPTVPGSARVNKI